VASRADALLVLGLGIVPTVMGHSTLNYCMRHMRGQWVSIANLGEFVFAGVMGYFLLDKTPQWNFYAAAAFVVAGAVVVIRSAPPGPQVPPIPPGD
jgi:drug/metabolite transporter (DMT)-like permease